MNPILEQLHKDHRNYTHLLKLLQTQVDSMSAGDDPNYLLMRDIMKYMINYPDILHHPAEELLFEELEDLDSERAEIINQLTREHELLADRAEQLEEELQNAISGHMASKDKIRDLAGEYIQTMRDHMLQEERKIFPVFESQLQPEQMARAREKLKQATDPVFSGPESDEYRRLYQSILDMAEDSGAA